MRARDHSMREVFWLFIVCDKNQKKIWGWGATTPPPPLYVQGLTCDQSYFREEEYARDTFISRDTDRPRSHLNRLAQGV